MSLAVCRSLGREAWRISAEEITENINYLGGDKEMFHLVPARYASVICVSLTLVTGGLAAHATQLDEAVNFNIPSQPLETVLPAIRQVIEPDPRLPRSGAAPRA